MKKVLVALILALAIGVSAQAAKQVPSASGNQLADVLGAAVESFRSHALTLRPLGQADPQVIQAIQEKRDVERVQSCSSYWLPDVGISNGYHLWGVANRFTPSSISCYISGNEPWDFWGVPVTPGEQITFALQSDVMTYFSVDHGDVFSDAASLQPDGTYLTGYVWTVPAWWSSTYVEISVSPYATSATYTLAVAKPAGSPPATPTPSLGTPTPTPPRGRETPTPSAPTPTPGSGGSCVGNSTTLCLNSSRFGVSVGWRTTEGHNGQGQAVPITGDTGYFWFFSANNVELVVKVVDGRAANGYFWVFYGALSDVEYTITVNDTATGRSKIYVGQQGKMASVADTAAFR